MKLVLLTAVFLGLTESGTVWSRVLLTKKIAPSVNVHSVEYSTKPAMLENGKDIQHCIPRLPLATQVDKNLIKEQIKSKLKKAWTKARKTQIKRNKEKQVRPHENEINLGTKKTKTKPPKHTPKPNKRKKVTRNRKPRHADVEFHASLKSISDEPFPEEKKKGTYENGNCKLQCTWDCHDFRCFRKCICNRIK